MTSDQQKLKMSENLPFEIQALILETLPVESLIRFRSVSKSWKSLIDSSHFITAYHSSSRHTEVQHLLIRSSDSPCGPNYISIVDDDTFPGRKVDVTLPFRLKKLEYHSIVGSSQGLVCLRGGYFNDFDDSIPPSTMAIIWNITIRKEVAVVVPNRQWLYHTVLGFGVCSETLDPKIVKINQVNRRSDMDSVTGIVPQVEVFTLSTGVWRNPKGSGNLPRKSVQIYDSQNSGCQVIEEEGILYWLANDRITMDGEIMYYNLLISFDLKSEEFREINLPDSLAHNQSEQGVYISELRESLVVLEHERDEMSFAVWIMEGVVTKTFTKMFRIHTPDALILSVFGFRKSGEPLIEVKERLMLNDAGADSLHGVYDPDLKDISDLGNIENCVSVYSYMETLLLFDQPNFIIYVKGKSYISKQKGKNKRHLKHTSKGKMKKNPHKPAVVKYLLRRFRNYI